LSLTLFHGPELQRENYDDDVDDDDVNDDDLIDIQAPATSINGWIEAADRSFEICR
jgi:hypothetical protein